MIESKLQKDCNKFLRDCGILYFHNEKGRGSNKRHRAGWPDLAIFRKNRTLFVELKTETGIVDPDQKALHKRLREAGFEVHVCRTIESFVETVTQWLMEVVK